MIALTNSSLSSFFLLLQRKLLNGVRYSILVLIFMSFSMGWAIEHRGVAELPFNYGANLSWGTLGNTSLKQGQWFPQSKVSLRYHWIESLGENLLYGELVEAKAIYLRLLGETYLSPTHGGFLLGLGLSPFPVNPNLELRFVYFSYLYFNSNVEMLLVDSTNNKSIADTWNSNYIFDKIWQSKASKIDFSQSFNFELATHYIYQKKLFIDLALYFSLIDIQTKSDSKSYDYNRNIPVFSRDYIIELHYHNLWKLNKIWGFSHSAHWYMTGLSKSKNGSELKKSLSYGLLLAGLQYASSNDKHFFNLHLGMWARTQKNTYNGDFIQQSLVQLEYQRRFDLSSSLRKEN